MIKTLFNVLLVTLLCTLPSVAGRQDNRKVEGTTNDIKWGEHWAGPAISNAKDLEGKVVLMVIWGG